MNHSDSLLVSSGFSWRGGKQLGNNHDALFQTSGPAATAAVITATTAATAPLGQCSRVNKNKLIINFSNKSSFLTMHFKLIFELILHPISPLLSVNPNPSGNPSFDQSAVPSDDHSSFPSANQSAVCISRSVIWSFRGLFSWSSADQSADPSADQSADPSADQSTVPSADQSSANESSVPSSDQLFWSFSC